MPKFVIEREMPGAGKMTPEQLRDASKNSIGVLEKLGPKIQWIHSYVTDDKIFCIYWAPNAELIQEHATQCALPANRISAIRTIIEPATSEG